MTASTNASTIKVAQVSKQPRTWKPQLPAGAEPYPGKLRYRCWSTGLERSPSHGAMGSLHSPSVAGSSRILAVHDVVSRNSRMDPTTRDCTISNKKESNRCKVMHQDHYLLTRHGNRLHLREIVSGVSPIARTTQSERCSPAKCAVSG